MSFRRNISKSLCMGTFVLLLLLLTISCDKVKRHKVLTFFFDGVPPLGLAYLDPNSAEFAEAQKLQQAAQKGSKHDTGEDCDFCHGGGTASVELVANPPELCYSCHENENASSAYVHGPVTVGDCLFCHMPHESSNLHLLIKKIPDLCYMCHDVEAIKLIDNHSTELYSICNNCHGSHAGSEKYFLKLDLKKK